MYEINFTPRARKDLEKLPREIQKRIKNKLLFFSSTSDPIIFAKPLVNFPPSTHRFRIGDYRIAFFIKDRMIYVEKIRNRKEVYLH